MPYCSKCGNKLLAEANFCTVCGNARATEPVAAEEAVAADGSRGHQVLRINCPACGLPAAPNYRYCPRCSNKLPLWEYDSVPRCSNLICQRVLGHDQQYCPECGGAAKMPDPPPVEGPFARRRRYRERQ